MKDLVLLSGENVELATGELKGVLMSLGISCEPSFIDGRSVIFDADIPPEVVERMGFSHFLGRIAYSEKRDRGDVQAAIKAGLMKADPDLSISVKIHSPDGKDEFSRSYIFHNFDEMARKMGFRVHHRDPEQKLFMNVGDHIISGTVVRETDRDGTDRRRGSRMPFNRPIVMEPKLARAMVNLAGLKPGSLVLDPFMGPAGLALEAAHLGYEVVGIERDEEIHTGALNNIKAHGMDRNVMTYYGDSRTMDRLAFWEDLKNFDGIITDPPFGRSAPLMGEDPEKLFIDVASKASLKMKRGSPLVMDSDRVDIFHRIEDFELMVIHPFRVHKSLTRYIGKLMRK